MNHTWNPREVFSVDPQPDTPLTCVGLAKSKPNQPRCMTLIGKPKRIQASRLLDEMSRMPLSGRRYNEAALKEKVKVILKEILCWRHRVRAPNSQNEEVGMKWWGMLQEKHNFLGHFNQATLSATPILSLMLRFAEDEAEIKDTVQGLRYRLGSVSQKLEGSERKRALLRANLEERSKLDQIEWEQEDQRRLMEILNLPKQEGQRWKELGLEQEIRKQELTRQEQEITGRGQELLRRERKLAKRELEIARQEEERQEQWRRERRRLEKERLEKERLKRQRLERERLERERLERERVERERMEREREERVRLERERIERERIERERAEQARLERERQEQAREQARLAQARQEQERRSLARREADRLLQLSRQNAQNFPRAPAHRTVLRRPLTNCYVCFDPIPTFADAQWCRAQCGQNICNECFVSWQAREPDIWGRLQRCGFWYVYFSFDLNLFSRFFVGWGEVLI